MIDREEIVTIANLAALGLSEEEVALYTSRLRRILQFFEKISGVDDGPIDPAGHPLGLGGPLRPDRIEPSLSAGALLQNTKFTANNFFFVKKVIE